MLPEAESDVLPAGHRVGEYEVVREIGRGGFGAVYEVVHSVLGKRAAAKVLTADRARRPDAIRRFVQEARAGARLEHPGIVDVFAYGLLDDGRPYFVMELLVGRTLAELLRPQRRLTLAEALPILQGVAEALDAAHASGVAHRDLKPANVFLEETPGGVRPRLLDFGVAKLIHGGAPHTTDDGAIVGTPHYMSPEQSRGRPVDARADLYALGVLCFRVLTGEHPFEADDPVGILVQHAAHTPPAPSSVVSSLPASVDRAVGAMLAKDPARRPGSARAAIDALAGSAAWRPRRTHVIGLVFALVAAGGVTLTRLRSPAGTPAPSASVASARSPVHAESRPSSSSTPPSPSALPLPERRPRGAPPPDPEGIEDPFRR